jgi:hypothetical protein
MTTVAMIMAILAVLFGFLVVRDVRTGDAGFVFATLRRWEYPVPFWGLVTIEAIAALLSAIVAVFAFTTPATCDEAGTCTVVIQSAEPPQ